jgi:hypothetical protein
MGQHGFDKPGFQAENQGTLIPQSSILGEKWGWGWEKWGWNRCFLGKNEVESARGA